MSAMSSQQFSRRAVISTGIGAAGAVSLPAAPGASQSQLLRRPYKTAADGQEREYYVYVPTGFHSEPGKKWPVMLFLHGGGERGDGRDDLKYTLTHGPITEAWIQGRDLPFVIIQPQMPPLDQQQRRQRERAEPPTRNLDGPPPPRNRARRSSAPMVRDEPGEKPRWDDPSGPPQGWWTLEQDLLGMVDATLEEFHGDPGRVYLTGLSYGGFGTWYMGSTYPERWAAIAPICGAGDASKVAAIAERKLPTWVFQGGRDTVVKTEWVMQTVRALEEAGHPEVRLTVHEDLAHNVWTRVYEGWDLYGWFLQHRKNR